MLFDKTKAAKLAGVSRRTFYNHIKKKGISVILDEDNNEKIDLSELKRVYGHESILNRLKEQGGTQDSKQTNEKIAQGYTQKSVKYEMLILQEKLTSAQTLIDQLNSERDQLREDKSRIQDQLEKALEIGAPIGKLLTDQRDQGESRAVVERKAIEESIRRENAEKRLKAMSVKMKTLKAENDELKNASFFKRLFG
ncbi:MAG: hypothetical protein AAFO07_04885 [Bacteroidota bacterium]